MKIEQGSNLTRAKVTNRSAIRRMIYLYGPITRTEISRKLNLTLPTITTNVNNMLANGTIRELGEKITTTDGSAGRKSGLLEINRDSRYFIGVEICRSERLAAIVDYKGKSIFHLKEDKYLTTYEDILQNVSELIQSLLKSNFVPKEKIVGIGMSIPGIVDSENGILIRNKQWDWTDRHLVEDLKAILNCDKKFFLENDSASRAIRYSMLNKKELRECGLFAYVLYRDGISCPIMLNDPSMVSKKLGPGELSYMIMESSFGMSKDAHNGRLSSVAGQRIILEQVSQLDIPAVREIRESGKTLDIQDVIRMQKSGIEEVNRIIFKCMEYLGMAISNVNNLLHPDYFVLEGELLDYEANREKVWEFCHTPQLRPDASELTLQFLDTSIFTAAEAAAFVAIQQDLGEYEE